jgi:AmiR/NasT family two-component response regulator
MFYSTTIMNAAVARAQSLYIQHQCRGLLAQIDITNQRIAQNVFHCILQLNRLGMSVAETDPKHMVDLKVPADVTVLDADSIPIKSDAAPALKMNVPVIALIGTETPSRLKWLLDHRPASFLIKPLQSAGLYTALVVAFDCAQRRSEEAVHIERLKDRIRSRRIVFSAVPKLMRAHGLSEEDAFTLIRQTAMRHRTTIEQLSAEIIALGGMPQQPDGLKASRRTGS